jgi:hypothetical protein
VVGGVRYGLLILAFNPLLIGSGYALLLAVLMTWSKMSHGRALQRRSKAPSSASSKTGTRRPSREKGEASNTPASAPDGALSKPPAAQNVTATPPKSSGRNRLSGLIRHLNLILTARGRKPGRTRCAARLRCALIFRRFHRKRCAVPKGRLDLEESQYCTVAGHPVRGQSAAAAERREAAFDDPVHQ